MDDRWTSWQAEVNRLTPFANEWEEGRVEDFIRNVLNMAAKKREQRDAILALAAEIKDLHVRYKQLLAFFNLERATASWAASACAAADVDRVLAALDEWRGLLMRYGPRFPPPEAETSSFAAMDACMREAQAAADAIRPCLDVLSSALGSAGDESRVQQDTAA